MLGVAPADSAQRCGLDEAVELLADEHGVLLANGFTEDIRLGETESGQHVGGAHHLFLIGDHAVGGLEHLLQAGVRVGDGFGTALSSDVDIGHAGVEGSGPDEGIDRDEVVEAIAAHRAQLIGGKRRFELEDAGGPAAGEHLINLTIIQPDVVPVDIDAMALAYHRLGVVDHGERLEAEKVELKHPGLLEAHHVVLGDDELAVLGFGSAATRRGGHDRYVVGERAGRDDDASGVDRRVADQSFKRHGVVEELAVSGLGLVERL